MRHTSKVLVQYTRNFNPRTHVGCDRQGGRRSAALLISIHAPTWGATGTNSSNSIPRKFQSTHPRGVRRILPGTFSGFPEFQSTHPRGVRRKEIARLTSIVTFQSTHPRGVRRSLCELAPSCAKFQSTHPRGVRLEGANMGNKYSEFQSTHPRGVRLNKRCNIIANFVISIHAPTWGATWITIIDFLIRPGFQSTHPRGVRRSSHYIKPQVSHFNPRTHVGCDNCFRGWKSMGFYFNPRTHVGCDKANENDNKIR